MYDILKIVGQEYLNDVIDFDILVIENAKQMLIKEKGVIIEHFYNVDETIAYFLPILLGYDEYLPYLDQQLQDDIETLRNL